MSAVLEQLAKYTEGHAGLVDDGVDDLLPKQLRGAVADEAAVVLRMVRQPEGAVVIAARKWHGGHDVVQQVRRGARASPSVTCRAVRHFRAHFAATVRRFYIFDFTCAQLLVKVPRLVAPTGEFFWFYDPF